MAQVIIYPNDDGSISLVTPASDCLIPVIEIARKDTPAGKPFLIIDAASFPDDHIFFDAFEADFSTPTGYGIGADAWFQEQLARGYL